MRSIESDHDRATTTYYVILEQFICTIVLSMACIGNRMRSKDQPKKRHHDDVCFPLVIVLSTYMGRYMVHT